MFDDQQSTTNSIPSNLPIAPEPEDMFSGVEVTEQAASSEPTDALKAGLLKKKEATASNDGGFQAASPMPIDVVPMSQPVLGKVIMFVVAAIVVGGLVFAGWWIYAKVTQPQKPKTIDSAVGTTTETQTVPVENTIVVQSTTNQVVNQNIVTNTTEIKNDVKSDTILFGQVVDSDKDGLDDIREVQIGTDPRNPDTDSDTLTDGEEVNVWKTNPLKKDTDGDSFTDSVEIKNGYNPNGPGKLSPLAPTSTATGTVR